MVQVGYRYKTLEGHRVKFVNIISKDESGMFEFKGEWDEADVTDTFALHLAWYDNHGIPMAGGAPRLDLESGRPIPKGCLCNKGSFQYHLKFCPDWINPMTEGLNHE